MGMNEGREQKASGFDTRSDGKSVSPCARQHRAHRHDETGPGTHCAGQQPTCSLAELLRRRLIAPVVGETERSDAEVAGLAAGRGRGAGLDRIGNEIAERVA